MLKSGRLIGAVLDLPKGPLGESTHPVIANSFGNATPQPGAGSDANADTVADDIRTLHALGYGQELLRRMSGFSNFAISLSIICILAGGITSFHLAMCSVGGAAIGVGWPLGTLLSLAFAATMGQLASAFPTAGGLYHWAAILGGRAWGWATAWLNLAGLITVLAAINVGTYLFLAASLGPHLGFAPDAYGESMSAWIQLAAVIAITVSQALINHRGIQVTTRLTDFSGYWILTVAVLLTGSLLWFAPRLEIGRLITFNNYSGAAGGHVWPETRNLVGLFALCLLLPAYTITGFDASSHTSEETIGAAAAVPRAIVKAVLISGVFGWIMLSAMVLAIPDMDRGAAQGSHVFFNTVNSLFPSWLAIGLYAGIGLAQYLCGLATVTSTSRVAYAFARDGGTPMAPFVRQVSPRFRTPAVAIWSVSLLSIAFAAYTPVYSTITSVCVIFLYVSYAIPTAIGLVTYRRSWKKMGPWSLGCWFRPLAVVCVIGCILLIAIGVQPPNDRALWILLGTMVTLVVFWFGHQRARFVGPPQGVLTSGRQHEIEALEQAVGQTSAGIQP